MKLLRTTLFFSFLLLLSSFGKGQLPSAFDRGAVGVSGGTMLFYGDLAGYDVLPKPDRFSKTFGRGYRVFLKRKIVGGLGARLGFEKGVLQGGHRNGRGAQHLSFRSHLMNFNLSANYELTRVLAKNSDIGDRRFYADLNVGIGMLFFRSYNLRTELGGYKEFYGYKAADIDKPGDKEVLLDRDKQLLRISVPVGVDFGYRVNHNTDITANVTLFNTTTDKLDSFVRDWTARDKFGYFGLGVTYNFNRSKDQYPEKKEEKKKTSSVGSDSTAISNIDISKASADKKGLFKRIFQGSNTENKRLLRIKLRLFQIQMKLFQMQYLLGQKKK